jgi:hypothetical protein
MPVLKPADIPPSEISCSGVTRPTIALRGGRVQGDSPAGLFPRQPDEAQPARMFNGYGDQAASLHEGMDVKKFFRWRKRAPAG